MEKQNRIERSFAAGMLAGVSMLVGGMESSVAATVVSAPSEWFNLHVSAADEWAGTGPVSRAMVDSSSYFLSFPKFDTSLGNLLGVSVRLESSAWDRGSSANVDGGVAEASGPTYFSVADQRVGFSVEIGGTRFDAPASSITSSTSCTADLWDSYCSNSWETLRALDWQIDFRSSLDAFKGTDDFYVTPELSLGAFFRISDSLYNSYASGSGYASGFWNGTATVSYVYEVPGAEPDPEPEPSPAAVPEPGTVALAALGLAGIGAVGRRRRRSR